MVLLVVVTVIATALRSGSSSSNTSAAIASVPPTQLAPNAPPAPVGLATAPGNLVLDVPVTQRRITAIVYHGVGTSQVIPLVPIGTQRNAGILSTIAKMLTGTPDGGGGPSYYIDDAGQGASTGSVDVGAVAGTDVYSPVDGKVVSIRPYVIDGQAYGSEIEIQPTSTPADVVTLTNLRTTTGIAVGTPVWRPRRSSARSSISPRCCRKRWPSTPPTRATTSTSRLGPHLRRPSSCRR